MARPKVNSEGQKSLDEAKDKFDAFEQEVKNLNVDQLNSAPVEAHEPQDKLTFKEYNAIPEIFLKPIRTIYPPPNPKTGKQQDVFNEKHRLQYEYDRQNVRFLAENHEIIGEMITCWTRPFPGMPAEMWEVPANVPVNGPRYLAEQIKRKCYHVLQMDNKRETHSDATGTIVGAIVAKATRHRLDAQPAPKQQISFNRKISNF